MLPVLPNTFFSETALNKIMHNSRSQPSKYNVDMNKQLQMKMFTSINQSQKKPDSTALGFFLAHLITLKVQKR